MRCNCASLFTDVTPYSILDRRKKTCLFKVYFFYLKDMLCGKGKGKVVSMHAMKAYWRVEVELHLFLTSTPDGGEWSTLRLGRFASGKSTRYPLNRRLVGPQNKFGRFGVVKIPCLCQLLNHDLSVVQPLVKRLLTALTQSLFVRKSLRSHRVNSETIHNAAFFNHN